MHSTRLNKRMNELMIELKAMFPILIVVDSINYSLAVDCQRSRVTVDGNGMAVGTKIKVRGDTRGRSTKEGKSKTYIRHMLVTYRRVYECMY